MTITVGPAGRSWSTRRQRVSRCGGCDHGLVNGSTVNPVKASDVPILLAVLGRLEGEIRGGSHDAQAVRSLGEGCRRAGLVPDDVPLTSKAVAEVLEDIGQRLRYALGEYSQDPTEQSE